MEKSGNVNLEQTVLWQKERIHELQQALRQERQGIDEMKVLLNGILLSLVNTFGSKTASGEMTLHLPFIISGGEKVEVSRNEKGGYTLKAGNFTEAESGK